MDNLLILITREDLEGIIARPLSDTEWDSFRLDVVEDLTMWEVIDDFIKQKIIDNSLVEIVE